MSTTESDTVYLRSVDVDAVAALSPSERFVQKLIDKSTGARACTVIYVRTPPGGRSPRGRHTHDVDQHVYVVSGTMSFDVDGERFDGGPGSLVFFPAHTPHENWNAGDEPTVHIGINAPLSTTT